MSEKQSEEITPEELFKLIEGLVEVLKNVQSNQDTTSDIVGELTRRVLALEQKN